MGLARYDATGLVGAPKVFDDVAAATAARVVGDKVVVGATAVGLGQVAAATVGLSVQTGDQIPTFGGATFGPSASYQGLAVTPDGTVLSLGYNATSGLLFAKLGADGAPAATPRVLGTAEAGQAMDYAPGAGLAIVAGEQNGTPAVIGIDPNAPVPGGGGTGGGGTGGGGTGSDGTGGGSGGSGGTGGGGGAGAPAGLRCTLKLKSAKVTKKQVALTLTCTKATTATIAGTAKVGRKTIKFKSSRKTLRAAVTATVKLRVPAGVLIALRQHKRVVAGFVLTAPKTKVTTKAQRLR